MAINKLKRGVALWTLRGKTNKDSNIVRAVDVNKIVDEVNTEFDTTNSNVDANTASIAALGGQVSGTKFTKTLTEAELDTLGSVGVEILPAVANSYYDISKIRVINDITGQEITYNNTLANRFWFTRNNGSQDLAYIDGDVLSNTVSKIGVSNIVNSNYLDLVNEYVVGMVSGLGDNIYLQLVNAVNPTKGGAGTAIPTVTVEVWYDLVTIP